MNSGPLYDPNEHVEGRSVQRWWDSLRNPDTEMSDILIKYGFNLETKNKTTGDNALILSCKNGRLAHLNLLLSNGANVNAQNKHGNTGLIKAILHGRYHIVNRLLQEKETIDINIQNNFGDSAFCIALRHNHFSIASLLLQNECNVNVYNECGEFPLLLACKNASLDVVTQIIERRNISNNYKQNNMIESEEEKNERKEDKNDLSSKVIDPLMMAIMYNRAKGIINILLEKNIVKVTQKHIEQLLQQNNASVLLKEFTEFKNIHVGLNKKDKRNELIQNMLHRAKENRKNILLEAASKNDVFAFRSTSNGINDDMDILSECVIVAAENKSIEVLKYLLVLGANPNTQSIQNGKSPLHLSCEQNDIISIQYLIKHGADVNVKCFEGNTPLISACLFQSQAAIKALLQAPTLNCDVRNKYNKKALEIAINVGNEKICGMLIIHDNLTRHRYLKMKERLEVALTTCKEKIIQLNRINLKLQIERKEAVDAAKTEQLKVSQAAKELFSIMQFFLVEKKRLRADDCKLFLENVKGIDTSTKNKTTNVRKTKKERIEMVGDIIEKLALEIGVKNWRLGED